MAKVYVQGIPVIQTFWGVFILAFTVFYPWLCVMSVIADIFSVVILGTAAPWTEGMDRGPAEDTWESFCAVNDA